MTSIIAEVPLVGEVVNPILCVGPLPVCGKKFLPLAMTSTDVIDPAALTFAESSARIPSGPNGISTSIFGGAAST